MDLKLVHVYNITQNSAVSADDEERRGLTVLRYDSYI